MSQLGAYLESLFSAPAEMSGVVEATIVDWRDEEVFDAARVRHQRAGKALPAPGKKTRGIKSCTSAQLLLPKYARVSEEIIGQENTAKTLLVLNPYQWHFVDRHQTIFHDDSGSERCLYLTDVQRHFDRSFIRQFIMSLRLENARSETYLERDCVQFRGYKRNDNRLWPHWLPGYADYYEFIGDTSNGFLYLIAGMLNDDVFEKYEVTSVHYDCEFNKDTFTFSGDSSKALNPFSQHKDYSTVEDAQLDVDFVIFKPEFVPDFQSKRTHIHVHGGIGHKKQIAMLSYFDYSTHKMLLIQQSATADKQENEYEWEQISEGGTVFKISDPRDEGQLLIHLVKSETYILITTDFPRAIAIQVASSLKPCK
jgi:hypothetical protein